MPENSNTWFDAVVRGDETPITIDINSTTQDNVIIRGNVGNQVFIE